MRKPKGTGVVWSIPQGAAIEKVVWVGGWMHRALVVRYKLKNMSMFQAITAAKELAVMQFITTMANWEPTKSPKVLLKRSKECVASLEFHASNKARFAWTRRCRTHVPPCGHETYWKKQLHGKQ